MRKKYAISNLSEFILESTPISVGGMSGDVYRAYKDGNTYFIKFGSLAEVIAESIFNCLASYCDLSANEVVIIKNDIGFEIIDSQFVVATKLVEGKEWQYTSDSPIEIVKQYAAFIALKVFMIDDDPAEFILKNMDLYSIDNSISGMSSMYLEILNANKLIAKKFGQAEYDQFKKKALDIASNIEVLGKMPQFMYKVYNEKFNKHGVAEIFKETLQKLAFISDETISDITDGMRQIYSHDAVDNVNLYLMTFRQIVKDIIEKDMQ